jgi:hypothetical protein
LIQLSIQFTTTCLHYDDSLHLHTNNGYNHDPDDPLAYKSATTTPATPSTPGNAVAIAPDPDDALLAAELAADERLEATEEAEERAEERAAELLLLATELAEEDALEAAELAEELSLLATELADEEALEAEPVRLLRTEPVT